MRGPRGVAISACAFALVLVSWLVPAHAVDPTQLPTPQLQARYLKLTHEFRCPVCQSETLADSEEQYAAEVRHQIRAMLLAGKSDAQIRDYLVSRYSEFILFKPEYSLRNAWLWLSPIAFLAIGIIVAFKVIRARSALVAEDDWTGEDDRTQESAREAPDSHGSAHAPVMPVAPAASPAGPSAPPR